MTDYSFLNMRESFMTNIAETYVSVIQKKSVENRTIQIASLDIDCGEWCAACIDRFADIPKMEADGVPLETRLKVIEKLRQGLCKGPCVCKAYDIEMKSNVVLITDNTILQDVSVEDIKKKVKDAMDEKYGKDIIPDIPGDKFEQIINDIKINISTYISQSAGILQVVKLQGGGTIQGIHMTSTIDAVMKVMANSKVTVKALDDIIQTIFSNIKKDVSKSFTEDVKSIWDRFKFQLYILFGIFGFLLIVKILAVFWKVRRIAKRKNTD